MSDELNGVIMGTTELVGVIHGNQNIVGHIKESGVLSGNIAIGGNVYPFYDGEYEVTPRVHEQILDTDGKVMSDDVTVHEIPVTRTTNPYGGQTVVIG